MRGRACEDRRETVKKRGVFLRILVIGFLALFLLSPTLAAAGVTVEVKIILASNDESGVDPALGNLAGKLSRFKFNSYKLLSVKSITVEPPGGGSVPLPGGKILQINETESVKKRVKMKVSVAGVVSTRVSLKKKGTVMLGGINHSSGELILAISAKF